MTFKEALKAILTSGMVWGALIVLADTLVDEFVPGMPQTVWNAVIGLVIAVLSAVGIIVEYNKARMRARARFVEDTTPDWSK